MPAKAYAQEPSSGPGQLYAQSAVLMDGDSGRVLFEKNGYEQRPMASTTKIMTLIVTLENANLDEVVTVSDYAASMPDVQLGIRAGDCTRTPRRLKIQAGDCTSTLRRLKIQAGDCIK